MAYNPSAIQIQRQLGASRPIRPPRLPTANATPKIASALNLHRMLRPGFADGGSAITDDPSQPFTGGILSMGAGRADDVQAHVPNGAYVMPAWSVAHLGEGNSVNGMTLLKGMFGSPWQAGKEPFGAPQPKSTTRGRGVGIPKPPPMHAQPPNLNPEGMSMQNPALEQQKHGGAARGPSGAVPVNLSGGEFVIEPDEVARIGDGNINKGHHVLDAWVLHLKQEAADTLKRLPGPAK